jgi:CAAX prenyl protease-like protein
MNRADGFLPHFFAESGAAYWLNLIPRLFRLIVVVPLVEEIFWRGWLARYLVNRDFTKTQVGTFTPLAFWGTSIGFMLEHSPADWPAAFVTGILFNVVAIKTGSLAACVVAHAVANLLLAAYVLQSHQWGYW